MCQHTPQCPSADDANAAAARIVRNHPEQGWELLCNGVILFEDGGTILPTGKATPSTRAVIPAQRGTSLTTA